MSVIYPCGPGLATRNGDLLAAELSYRPDGKKARLRTWQRSELDAALAAWFDAAADGDQVEVFADVDISTGHVVQVRMAHPPAVTTPRADQARLDELKRLGGGVNPYTFIPTLPRDELPPGLGDGAPAPHGVIEPATQWSGWLALRLVTRTPLLLPDPEAATRDADDHPTYPVRKGPDGQPLLHGASVKGALRSAYETVTGSRYGVFRRHDRALAYRQPATKPDLIPARVESDGQGGLQFRLCAWPPLSVPLYDPRRRPGQPGRRLAQATGTARAEITGEGETPDWRKLHGREVWYTTRDAGKPGNTRLVVDQVTLATEPRPEGAGRGWLSITGRSIENKANERLFVPTSAPPVQVETRHHELWQAVLASYRDAAEYNEPGLDPAGKQLERSRHVPAGREVPSRLEEGDLVYLDVDRAAAPRGPSTGRRATASLTVDAVHPVIFGRLPYQRSPAQALDDSLRPAAELEELSPADRLFGWAPASSGSGRRTSSGYRGRLRIAAITCQTSDWLTDHGPGGVTMAPLSSPKPTQFRFYAAADENGTAVERGAAKKDGYHSGLRGRKAYWYPSTAPDGYWKPGPLPVDSANREWQAHPEAKRSQTSTHRGWVREGAEFTISLFLDAVPTAELGPLIWLATQDGCPLRLGAGKPYGFGAVAVSIDWNNTELRTGEALRGCWLALRRPAPAPRADIEELAAEFGEVASAHPVLAPAIAAWRIVAQGSAAPAHYPRTRKDPEAETYRWFVENERMQGERTRYGFALPHVLEEDQRLPFLPREPGNA
jgi:CRISPR-associated protein (TIGR03986 family)